MRFLSLVALFVLLANTATAQTEPNPVIGGANANVVRAAKGTIVYSVLSSGAVLGDENWNLTVHPDGSRTMQAINRYGSPGVQRHVTYRVDAKFRPIEAYLLYWVGGKWRGSGLFSVHGDQLTAVANTPNGQLTHNLTVPENFSFIPHPLSTDAWHMSYYDKAKEGEQTITVYDMDAGAAGPQALLGRLYQQKIKFIGAEQVTTKGGAFATDHFKIENAVDVYVTGPDAILVKFLWTPADRLYELVKLEQTSQ
ncbi:MAG: hypothetical protein EXR11_02910 [Rhodospirillaceae bacterium]|nr:hypothetical protein [Rhodospirillaceae bacterium]